MVFIYFVRESGNGLIKIGSSQRPKSRFCQLQRDSPVALTLLAVVRGSRQHEIRLHEHFAESKAKGEWFYPSPELCDFITSLPAWHNDFDLNAAPVFSGSKRNIYFELYRAGYTQSDIAEHFGFSRQRANQLIAIKKDNDRYATSTLKTSQFKTLRPKPDLPIADFVRMLDIAAPSPLEFEPQP